MNTNAPDNDLRDLERISAAYREARFDEGPPSEIDRAILAEARRGSRRRIYALLPAFAVAATVVLAVSLVLRPGMLNQSADIPTSGALSDSPEAFAPAAITIERDADVEEAGAETPPSALDEVVAPTVDNFELERAVQPAAAEQRARELAPAPRREAAGTSADLQSLPPERSMLDSAALAAPFSCAGVDRGNPEAWIACIDAGAEQGFQEEARTELDAFIAAYPDYALPQSLTSLLDR